MGYGLYVISSGTGLIAPVTPLLVKSNARLVSAPGDQDHTTSPSVLASVVHRRSHVHRSPPLRIVTTRTSLFDEAGWRQPITISLKTKHKYFAPAPDIRVRIDVACEIRCLPHLLARPSKASAHIRADKIAQVICPTCRIGHNSASSIHRPNKIF
jgi:hypothetical protein